MKKTVVIKEEKRDVVFNWVSAIYYPHETVQNPRGYIDVKLNEALEPFLLEPLKALQKEYTQCRTKPLLALGGKYSVRILSWLRKWWRAAGGDLTLKVQYTKISDFRNILVLDGSKKLNVLPIYPQYERFKTRILEPSLQSINENSDIYVFLISNKQGKSVVGLTFFYAERNLFSSFEDFLLSIQYLKKHNIEDRRIKNGSI